MKMPSVFHSVLLVFGMALYSGAAPALNIDISPGEMRLDGEIKPGDAERVAAALGQAFQKKVGFGVLSLNSTGGSLIDALRIAQLFKTQPMLVYVDKGAVCASSCVFIWLTGHTRIATGKVGLHRPYLARPYAEAIGLESANIEQEDLMRSVNNYLVGENFPKRLIDEMMGRPSNDVYWLKQADKELIGKYAPAYEEELISKCNYSRAWERKMVAAMDRADSMGDHGAAKKLDAEHREFMNCESKVSKALWTMRKAGLEKISSGWRPWK